MTTEARVLALLVSAGRCGTGYRGSVPQEAAAPPPPKTLVMLSRRTWCSSSGDADEKASCVGGAVDTEPNTHHPGNHPGALVPFPFDGDVPRVTAIPRNHGRPRANRIISHVTGTRPLPAGIDSLTKSRHCGDP
ncbi:hypothetical protein Z043_111479 [Scleropages formosus]|uniref:Uncharacterized protein n=1 Tax=Scleropages formosus TaxID=113540 RepID=A0A0N8JZM4_SCLFO|nr:hypothetical protein Z043_111479 [Scleropages formosus]